LVFYVLAPAKQQREELLLSEAVLITAGSTPG